MDTTDEIVVECNPYMRQYKSGHVVRLKGTDVVPASVDPSTGVSSKDVIINPITGVSARLYLPTLSNIRAKKLPIVVYYHGGAFIIESATSPTYHNYVNLLAARSGVLVVSVDYRRAPEHPLPAAYDDSRAALKWVVSDSADTWLTEHGDFARLFLAGDSAGANIAHHVALHSGVKVEGMALVHPYFWGSEPVGTETTAPETRAYIERLWRVVCPATDGVDDPLINPLAAAAPRLKGLACRRVMVFVAGKDVLRERGRAYYEALLGSGWGGEAELMEAAGEGHVFHLYDHDGENAVAKMERMIIFLNMV